MKRPGSSLVGSLALGAALLLAVFGTCSTAQDAPAKEMAAVRVGVFDRTKILVAYYGSEIHDRIMRDLMAKHAAAKGRGDDAEVKRLEAEGAARQDLAHEQLEGKAELVNVIEALRPSFTEVAEAADVSMIVEKPLWIASAPAVELVDVTEALAARLPPPVRK